MDIKTIILFTATVLPLICTPGPDMLFVASQALSGRVGAGLRATAGICLGYSVHSALVTLGIAAVLATSPVLFAILRWLGVAYLLSLACLLMRAAIRARALALAAKLDRGQLRRGFMTAVLNPKGMMIYFALLPQFLSHDAPIGSQALILSGIFIALCGVVYTGLSLIIAAIGKKNGFSDRRRRWVEGTAGGLLIIAAGRLAAN